MISDNTLEKLKNAGQEHVLAFYDELRDEEKVLLEKQLENLDLETVENLFKQIGNFANENKAEIAPLACTVKSSLSDEVLAKYNKAGIEIMKKGQYAVVTMAGGQGTRLGHNGPKGTFFVHIPEPTSLFEIQCRRLKAASEECGKNIPWYIMTSEENDAETQAFFRANNFFGYPESDIFFFRQYMLPMVDENGKLILEEKYKIKEGADGHGGIFRAMLGRGVIDDMKRRNVQWIFVGGIDNILVQATDTSFLGFVSSSGYKLGGKSLIKRDAYEKVGVFCKKNGKPFVIEYTEISKEQAELTDEKGQFVYGDAHILCNMFHIDVFEKMGSKGLAYHEAHKKTSFINKQGEKITPDKPNAYKFEAFIFDAFAYYDNMGIFRVKREHEFAPIKNKTGEDSPETARTLYLNYVLESGKL